MEIPGQGRRPDQYESSMKIAFYSIIGIIAMFILLLFTSCTPEEEVLSYEYLRPNYKAFITTDGTQSYNQTIYLDTIEDYVYTKIYAGS